MLQHLSVSHFYTLRTHNLTKFLLCWRVLFCLLSFGCCPPVPPSFLCTLFFFFNFSLSFHFLMFFFYYSSWYSSIPSFISIFQCFFFITYSFFLFLFFFLLFLLIFFLSPFFFLCISHSLAFIYDHTENVELLGSMCFLFTIFMFSWNPEFVIIQSK